MHEGFDTVPDRTDTFLRRRANDVLLRAHTRGAPLLSIYLLVFASSRCIERCSHLGFSVRLLCVLPWRSSASQHEAWELLCGAKADSLCPSWTRRISPDLRFWELRRHSDLSGSLSLSALAKRSLPLEWKQLFVGVASIRRLCHPG